MSDNEYTPTTNQVRELYAARRESADMQAMGVGRVEFDRWLAAHDRQVAAKAKAAIIQRLRDTAQPGRSDSTHHAVADWLEQEAEQ